MGNEFTCGANYNETAEGSLAAEKRNLSENF